jgi:phospholipid/cholesterol/gamma-HCH transport system permease protein
VLALIRTAQAHGLEADEATLPQALRKLVRIALAVPPRGPKATVKEPFFIRLGQQTVDTIKDSRGFFEFLGELTIAFGRLLLGKARFRRSEFLMTLQNCGVDALPIVALISILVGIILGFVGGVQLQRFGATIFMVDLVALAMAREMGCIMTGVIMSGRTGAAFAAQIGSMNVNEEVDALSTLGFSPMEYLVLPRALAMILMMPLLTIYADILGWIGGFIVGLPLGIGPSQYWTQLTGSLGLTHILVGVIKSFFFGVIVAASGCYYGLRSGRSSASVGQAATSAVVAGITWIIILDAIFAFVLQFIGL